METYEEYLIAAGGLALLSSVPGVAALGLWILVIPGLVLIFAATAFTYMLTIYPAVLAFRKEWPLSLVASIAALLVGLVSFGLPAFARYQFSESEFSIQTNDFVKKAVPSASVVVITLRSADFRRSQPDEVTLPCGYLCQALLRNGIFQSVYVSSSGITLRYELINKGCELEVRDGWFSVSRRPQKACYSFEPVQEPLPDAIHVIDEVIPVRADLRSKYSIFDSRFWIALRAHRVEVYSGSVSADELVLQKSILEGEVARAPFLFDFKWSSSVPDKLRLVREATLTWEEIMAPIVVGLIDK